MSETVEKRRGCLVRILQALFGAVFALLLLPWTIWAAGALHYDLPDSWPKGVFAGAFLVLIVAALVVFRGSGWRVWIAIAALCALVTGWWLTIEPTNEGNWQPNVSKLAWAEINDDLVTLHNIRDCEYRTEHDYTPVWTTRTVDVSRLRGIDMFLTYWGSPYIAHPIISFQFDDAPPVTISIETRMKVGQGYSAVAGFYRQFTLTYVVAEERDTIRLRTDFREGEDTYLFRLAVTPERARKIFLNYLETVNDLKEHATFYNALTNNCTTGINMHAAATTKSARLWDWRILLPGKLDELLYREGSFKTTLPFDEYKVKSHINPVGTGIGRVDDYGTILRRRVPTYLDK